MSVAFSPDGKTLASGGSLGIRFWDTEASVAKKERGSEYYKEIGKKKGGESRGHEC